jgi:hypothetical protein
VLTNEERQIAAKLNLIVMITAPDYLNRFSCHPWIIHQLTPVYIDQYHVLATKLFEAIDDLQGRNTALASPLLELLLFRCQWHSSNE